MLADIVWVCSVNLGKAFSLITSAYYLISSLKHNSDGEFLDARDLEERLGQNYEQRHGRYRWQFLKKDLAIFFNENTSTLESLLDIFYLIVTMVVFIRVVSILWYRVSTPRPQTPSTNPKKQEKDEIKLDGEPSTLMPSYKHDAPVPFTSHRKPPNSKLDYYPSVSHRARYLSKSLCGSIIKCQNDVQERIDSKSRHFDLDNRSTHELETMSGASEIQIGQSDGEVVGVKRLEKDDDQRERAVSNHGDCIDFTTVTEMFSMKSAFSASNDLETTLEHEIQLRQNAKGDDTYTAEERVPSPIDLSVNSFDLSSCRLSKFDPANQNDGQINTKIIENRQLMEENFSYLFRHIQQCKDRFSRAAKSSQDINFNNFKSLH